MGFPDQVIRNVHTQVPGVGYNLKGMAVWRIGWSWSCDTHDLVMSWSYSLTFLKTLLQQGIYQNLYFMAI